MSPHEAALACRLLRAPKVIRCTSALSRRSPASRGIAKLVTVRRHQRLAIGGPASRWKGCGGGRQPAPLFRLGCPVQADAAQQETARIHRGGSRCAPRGGKKSSIETNDRRRIRNIRVDAAARASATQQEALHIKVGQETTGGSTPLAGRKKSRLTITPPGRMIRSISRTARSQARKIAQSHSGSTRSRRRRRGREAGTRRRKPRAQLHAPRQPQHALRQIPPQSAVRRILRLRPGSEKSPVPEARSSTSGRGGNCASFSPARFHPRSMP